MANILSRANIPSRLNPTAEAFVPTLRSPLSIWSPLDIPSTCWQWTNDVAQAAPDGEGESFSSRSPAENVLSLSKESTNLMTSGFSELSKEEFQQNDGLHERNFLAAGLEAPDKRMDDRVKQQVKIMFLKDYLVTRYVKCLRAIPTKLEETSEVITNACTDIMAFEGIITSSSHEGSSSDYSEAIRNILKAVGRLEALIEVLTKVRLSTESRLYLEGLGHLLHNT